MAKLTIDKDRCKACGLCVSVCPKKVLKLSEEEFNIKGYTPIKIVAIEDCIACGMCGMICPDYVIKIEK